MSVFSFSSDVSLARSPLRVVVPFDLPSSGDRFDRFVSDIKKPLTLMTPSKKTQDFDVSSLFDVSIDASGERPVVVIDFSDEGWDNLSYVFLTSMAQQVKTNPKSVPRSMRLFANLMGKLTPKPTGNGKIDQSRRVVIERTMQDLAPGLREQITRRVQSWS